MSTKHRCAKDEDDSPNLAYFLQRTPAASWRDKPALQPFIYIAVMFVVVGLFYLAGRIIDGLVR